MQISLPLVINDPVPEKNSEYWKEEYGSKFYGELAFDIANRIYIRTRLSEAQNWKCCWCGIPTTHYRGKKNSSTLEHIVPRSMGGTDDIENLAMACSKCNSRRGTTDINIFLANAEKTKKSARENRREKRERRYLKRAEKFSSENWKEQTFAEWLGTISRAISKECKEQLINLYGVQQ